METEKIYDKLDKISTQIADVKNDTVIHTTEIKHINNKLERGHETFDKFRSQFEKIDDHLAKINNSMVSDEKCASRHREFTDFRKWLYRIIIGGVLVGGSGTAVGVSRLDLIKKFFGLE